MDGQVQMRVSGACRNGDRLMPYTIIAEKGCPELKLGCCWLLANQVSQVGQLGQLAAAVRWD